MLSTSALLVTFFLINAQQVGIGLMIVEALLIDVATNRRVGRVYNMNSGASLKLTCGWHNSCSVWVTCRPGCYLSVLLSTYTWLGNGRGCTKEQHAAQAKELKVAHHMNVRGGVRAAGVSAGVAGAGAASSSGLAR